MGITVSQLWNQIVTVGIADPNTCRTLAVEYAKTHAGNPPTDPKSLAVHLIRCKVINEFQAKTLLVGRGNELRHGSYLITQPMLQAPFKDWLWGRIIGSSGPESLIFPLSFRIQAPVDWQWINQQQQIICESLQPIGIHQPPGMEGYAAPVWVVSPLPVGQSLADALKETKRLDSKAVARLGVAIGTALKAMHAAGISHGSIDPERVWLGNDKSIRLLREIIKPSHNPFQPPLGWFNPLARPALYAAPEFSIPGKMADPLTDQYALGCLLLHALTGDPPFSATNTGELVSQHATAVPPLIEKTVRLGVNADPVLRIISYAMSKNAGSRFPDIQHLITALLKIAPDSEARPQVVPSNDASDSAISALSSSAVPPPPPADQSVQAPNMPASSAPIPNKASSFPGSVPSTPNGSVDSSLPTPPEIASPTSSAVGSEPPAQTVSPVQPSPGLPPQSPNTPTAPPQPPLHPGSPPVPGPVTPVQPPPGTGVRPVATQPVAVEQTSPQEKVYTGRRLRRKKKKYAGQVVAGLGIAVVVLLVLVLTKDSSRNIVTDEPPKVVYRPPSDSKAKSSKRSSTDASKEKYVLVDDDSSLWAPPDNEDPPALTMLPPGAPMIVHIRPKALYESAEGQQLLSSLDRDIKHGWDLLEQRTGMPPYIISQVSLAIEGIGQGRVSAAMSVQLSQSTSVGVLRKQWKVAPLPDSPNSGIYVGENPSLDAYYIAGENVNDQTVVTSFSVGSLDQIKRVAEIKGTQIPLPSQLEKLWNSTSREADLSILVTPNFLFSDGRRMLEDYAPALSKPLRMILVPNSSGVLLTTTLRPEWFVETRMTAGPTSNPLSLSRKVGNAVAKLPDWSERFLLDSSPDPSWRALSLRLPQMMRAVTNNLRYGVSNNQSTANLYLPSIAAANVSLASLLAANTPSGRFSSMVKPDSKNKTPVKLTLTEMLERPLSVSFAQQSLEFSIDDILAELNSILPKGTTPPKVIIIGGDLQKEGITQNQQIRDFNLQNKKFRSVLTELVRRANPDATVKSVTEQNQKLVWVVAPNPNAPNEQAILITTRAASQDRYRLPAEFVDK